jgi:hypothetical protein
MHNPRWRDTSLNSFKELAKFGSSIFRGWHNAEDGGDSAGGASGGDGSDSGEGGSGDGGDSGEKSLEEQIATLKGIVAKERKITAQTRKELKRFEGVDLDEYISLKKVAKKNKEKEGERQSEYDRLLAEQKAQTEAANKRAADAIARAALTSEFIKAGGNESLLTEFLAVATKDIELVEDAVQVPSATYFKEDGTEVKTVAELMDHWRDQTPRGVFFNPQDKSSGSGKPPTGEPKSKQPNTLSVADLGNDDALEKLASGEAVLRG